MRVGEHDVNSEKDGASPQEILIAAKMPHEKFDSVSFQNDIAILKLSQKVKLTRKSHIYARQLTIVFNDIVLH